MLEMWVRPDEKRILLTVQMPDPECWSTAHVPHVPRLLFRLLPRLGQHKCHNHTGRTFRQECKDTEIAHLFEHLILELQLQAQQNPDDYLSGVTEWNWQVDPRGRYHVSVDYDNELLGIACIRMAERIIAALDKRDLSLNIETEIRRLREVLRLGRELMPEPGATTAPPPVRVRSWSSASQSVVSAANGVAMNSMVPLGAATPVTA